MKKVIIVAILLLIFSGFYHINIGNYETYLTIKQDLVQHPEGLPEKEFAKKTAIGFQNLRADIYRLEAIQYIGGNAINSEYKKYLFKVLDLVTELNPFFEHPYIIGELLLPSYNERYESLPDEEQQKNIHEAEQIGLKGVRNFCNMEKVEAIKQEEDLQKIWSDAYLRNPCQTYSIPYYLAYIYYFYKQDPITASSYYKVASANDDAVSGAKVMAAIMQGKGGNRQKAFLMFLNIAKFIEDNESCQAYAEDVENTGLLAFQGRIPLNGYLIKTIEDSRNTLFGTYNPEDEKNALYDTQCSNFVNKAIRELNLLYIEAANEQFKTDHNGNTARNAKALLNEGYIDFLPTDFQQYETYGIIYEYNPELGTFDYTMGNYDN